jgi:PAS domain S-box-containing protein
MQDRLKILFVGGSDGSLGWMARELLNQKQPLMVECHCAGLTSATLAPEAVKVLHELGLTASPEGCLPPEAAADPDCDLIVTLDRTGREFYLNNGGLHAGKSTQPHLRAGFPIRVHWAIDDDLPHPGSAMTLEKYRVARERLQHYLLSFINDGYLAAISAQRDKTRQLIDSLRDGIIIHDNARRISVFNRAAEQITGYRREDVLGRDCHVVFGGEGICGGQCAFNSSAPQLRNDREYQMSFPTRDGEDKLLRMSVTPLEGQDNNSAGVIVALRDVTEVSELRHQLKEKYSFHGMVGISSAMREIFKTIRQVVASDYPVLITGESGTGKELVARAVHNESRRHGGPFVPVNCGALPENILESELFGHVRGAFTGAIRDKKGRFELADGGTLFLDEVAELTPAFQVKLLRVLQEQQFERVGGEQQITVNVRVISATNRDLRELVKKGEFREDLFYRLAVVPISLPPLRKRRDDILPLIEQILVDIRRETGNNDLQISAEAVDQLLRHSWPGNVRELINALRFSSVRCGGARIHVQHLPPEVRQASGAESPAPVSQDDNVDVIFPKQQYRNKLDPETIGIALARAGGNKVRAAKMLGVGRATLYRFLHRFPEIR